jgi:hypothetical protein
MRFREWLRSARAGGDEVGAWIATAQAALRLPEIGSVEDLERWLERGGARIDGMEVWSRYRSDEYRLERLGRCRDGFCEFSAECGGRKGKERVL